MICFGNWEEEDCFSSDQALRKRHSEFAEIAEGVVGKIGKSIQFYRHYWQFERSDNVSVVSELCRPCSFPSDVIKLSPSKGEYRDLVLYTLLHIYTKVVSGCGYCAYLL